MGKYQPTAVLDEGELRVVETLARTALVIIGLGLLAGLLQSTFLFTNKHIYLVFPSLSQNIPP